MVDIRNKKFLSLLGNIRGNPVRVNFQNQIDSNNLLDDFIYSYNVNGNFEDDEIITLEDDFGITKKDALHLTSIHVIIQSYDSMDLSTPMKENELENDVIDSILSKKPFIFIGRVGYLKYLKNQGFRTFSTIWDESYNEETYWIDSIIKVIGLLKSLKGDKILNYNKELKEIVNHNYKIIKSFDRKEFI